MNWIDAIKEVKINAGEVLTFNQYLDYVNEKPSKTFRPTAHYLKDMFDFFGTNQDNGFSFFQQEDTEYPAVFGHESIQRKIYQNLLNFIEDGYINKFLLLVGPNGSAKSSLVKKIMDGAQRYSRTDDGALYTFSWIFPVDKVHKGSLGLTNKNLLKSDDIKNSYAFLDDSQISAILTSELKDHPILLVPIEQRQKMIDILVEKKLIPDSVLNTYLYNSDLSKRNKLIFDALYKNYQGDINEVYKHIRVERFYIDRKYSTGAVTIEPQLHIDAQNQQITMDRRLATLPPSLQSLNLFSSTGELVLANRGILEYSDLLKRPLDTFKYLLMTMETRNINIKGNLTELDILFMGSSNEVHFNAFKQHPDFLSFKGRFNFIKVPYLLNYKDEHKIYKNQLATIKKRVSIAPHVSEALCLWSIMTRLRHPLSKNYNDKSLSSFIERINPLEKALFISNKKNTPKYLTQDQQHILIHNHENIINEFENETIYEGKFGISPREVKNIIYDLTSNLKSVSLQDLIDHLTNLITLKDSYEFLSIEAQGDYCNHPKILQLLENYYINILDKELRESLGLVDDRSYEHYISKYVTSINALIKNEKVKNPVTGKYEQPDLYFIKEFESNIDLKEEPEIFRSHVISKLGAYYLDNPGAKITYTEVLSNITTLLKESFRKEQVKHIQTINNNLLQYISKNTEEESSHTTVSISADAEELIENTLSNLQKNFYYNKDSALKMMQYILRKKY